MFLLYQNLAIQTEPPPSTAFSVNVSLGEIFDAYIKDYEKVLEKEKEREKEKEKERERERERDRERGTLKGKQVVLFLTSYVELNWFIQIFLNWKHYT